MNEDEIKILRIASCLSLSERSTITYEIGCEGCKTIFIRLTANTGAGKFSHGLILLEQIALLLSADDKRITAKTLQPIYNGSVNSAGFLLAALRNEGLIKNTSENSRDFIRSDPNKIASEIYTLLEKEVPPQKKSAKAKEKKNSELIIDQEP